MKQLVTVLFLLLSLAVSAPVGSESAQDDGIWVTNNPVPADETELELYLPDRKGKWEITLVDPMGNMIEKTHHYNGGLCLVSLKNRKGRRIASGSYLALLVFTDHSGKRSIYKKGIGVKR